MILADEWEKEHPNSDEAILKTKAGFILKSNRSIKTITETLNKFKDAKIIMNYKETNSVINKSGDKIQTITNSYSVIIGSVEHDITNEEIGDFLTSMNVSHRYCKRIISRATNKPTYLVRIISGCMNSTEKLLNEGFFYKHRHYPVFPSLPPAPLPQPCSKCQQFTHTTENCTSPQKCAKCGQQHHTSNCTTELAPKCMSCGAEDHAAWSLKCPRRPTKPIEGIPNTQIKALNKKTKQIETKITQDSRIHAPVTVHDLIINTYINKLNKEKYTDREELIKKLRKRYIFLYNIDTICHFSGTRLYILMFDLDEPLTISPTQPIEGTNNVQIQIST